MPDSTFEWASAPVVGDDGSRQARRGGRLHLCLESVDVSRVRHFVVAVLYALFVLFRIIDVGVYTGRTASAPDRYCTPLLRVCRCTVCSASAPRRYSRISVQSVGTYRGIGKRADAVHLHLCAERVNVPRAGTYGFILRMLAFFTVGIG